MIKCQICDYRKFSLKFRYKKKPPKKLTLRLKKKKMKDFLY